MFASEKVTTVTEKKKLLLKDFIRKIIVYILSYLSPLKMKKTQAELQFIIT